jgi:hypothetical protein
MHLVGQLSNPSASLMAVFEAAAVARPESRELWESVVLEPASGRLGNGVVQRAVVKVLAMAQRPMCGQEVRLGVEALLGHPVSENSISSCLARCAQAGAAVRESDEGAVRSGVAQRIGCRTSIAGSSYGVGLSRERCRAV